MSDNLSDPMLRARKASMTSGPGEAWFYISPKGIEVCTAERKGEASSNCFIITERQLRRAIEVIDEFRGMR